MMKIHQNAIARRKPIGQKKSRRTMYRPRDCGGKNSESSDGSTTSIPPRPSPARRRNPKTLHGSHAAAVRAVKTEYEEMERGEAPFPQNVLDRAGCRGHKVAESDTLFEDSRDTLSRAKRERRKRIGYRATGVGNSIGTARLGSRRGYSFT